jgi:transposase-like protein
MKCKFCGSEHIVKAGFDKNKQLYRCKDCKHRFYDNGNFTRMRNKREIIKVAIELFYEGLSARKTQKQIAFLYGVKVSQAAILKWLYKYSKLVKAYTNSFQAELGGVVHVDETVLKCHGQEKFFWQAIDPKTKFLIATHLSDSRTEEDAKIVFSQIKMISRERPKEICVDGYHAYIGSFRDVFFRKYKNDRVELRRRVGIRGVYKNNPVERLHGTLKDRTRIMRSGLGGKHSTKNLLAGWHIHYNYLRGHQTLKGKTPAQVAGINIDTSQRWGSLIEQATWYNTNRR